MFLPEHDSEVIGRRVQHAFRFHFMNLSQTTRIPSSATWLLLLVLIIGPFACSCRLWQAAQQRVSGAHHAANSMPNPLAVPLLPRDVVMDQVSDELDNYFRIDREERVRLVNSILTEGWIETHPRIASTLLEPWHGDSTPGYEKLLATMQTIRRFARVRIIPKQDNYQIDVKVYKELEDLPQPEQASVSGNVIRYDNSVDINRRETIDYQRTKGWIPLGRDITLEQKILANIQTRLNLACESHPTGLHVQ